MSEQNEPGSEEERQVFVRFRTSLEGHAIPEDRIAVPSKLRRLGLSQIVNHLLGRADKPIPFDFLIDNVFLRTSLKTHIKKHNLNEEDVLVLEYVLAVGTPEPKDEFPHPDWVSAIPHHQSSIPVIVSGSYDGIIRIWKEEEEEETKGGKKKIKEMKTPFQELHGHTGPIKALSVKDQGQGKFTLLSASRDSTLKVWQVTPNGFSESLRLLGHEDSVEDCDIHQGGELALSAGFDGKVNLWKIQIDEEDDDLLYEEEANQEKERKQKRRKLDSKATAPARRPLETMEEHKESVSQVRFMNEETFLTSSYDHTLKIWNLESARSIQSFVAKDVLYCLSYNETHQSVATGHVDGAIRIWDIRAQKTELFTLLSSHTHWVTSISFLPSSSSSSSLFTSSSHDGSVKLWDLRSQVPLATIKGHEGKVLSADWFDSETILSGGTDNRLLSFNVQK